MNKTQIKKRNFWFILILWAIGLCTLIGIGTYLIKKNTALRYTYTESKKIDLGKKIYVTRKSIYQTLTNIENHVINTTTEFDKDTITNIPSYLQKTLESLTHASGIGIAFNPYEYEKKDKFYASYIVREKQSFKQIDIQKYYNYMDKKWYQTAFNKKITWIDPFLEVSTNQYVLRIVSPIYRFETSSNTRIPIGVFFIDISRSDLNTIVNETIYDTNTYAFLMSYENRLISHPIKEYLDAYNTLFELSQLLGKKDWHRVGKEIEHKIGGITTYTDSLAQKTSWVAFDPLGISNWCVVYVTYQDSLFSIPSIRHNTIQLAGLFCALFVYLLALIAYFLRLKYQKSIIAVSAVICFILLTIFQIFLISKKTQSSNETVVKNEIDFARFKDFQQQSDQQLGKPKSIYIPTGIIVTNIMLQSANKFEIQGLIWQKYDQDASNLKKEINFINTESFKLTELYQIKKDDSTTIGWNFNIVLNTIFDQSKYPFNEVKLNIQIFHPDFEKNIILTPDFNSYSKHSGNKIGISKEIILGKGLHVYDSYFSYKTRMNQSNFGILNAVRQQEFPDLSFEIDAKQGITNPLIAYLFPLLIISLILYYILLEKNHLTSSESSPRIVLLGQTGALFLALVFIHGTLRNFLKINTVAFLESFYFIVYGFTFLVASNCILRNNKKSKLISFLWSFYQHLQYLYWPLIFALVFIVTLYFFY